MLSNSHIRMILSCFIHGITPTPSRTHRLESFQIGQFTGRREFIYKRSKRPLLLHVLNLVRTKHISGVKRGARVKAMAISSQYPWIHVFKVTVVLLMQTATSSTRT
jgi:hypothetical protein